MWSQLLFPSLTWSYPTADKVLYLTFDDGPTPEVTSFVLKTLKKYDACATFFLIGKNIKNNPGIMEELRLSPHSLGNHTMNHRNGWKTNNKDYFADIDECNSLLNSRLFRPPYGKLSFTQILHLKKKYKIIMWSTLSRDYDNRVTPQQCAENATRNSGNGSIIVFHDSVKAWANMLYALPETLKYFSGKGYRFEALPDL